MASTLDKDAEPPAKLPFDKDPANCPICQEILLTGTYVMPLAAALPLLTVEAFLPPIVLDTVTTPRGYSHDWKSRAPPLV